MVKAVYMEVDVVPEQRQAEADWIVALCRKADSRTVAAVIAGDLSDEKLRDYLSAYRNGPIRGVRKALRPQWRDNAAVEANLRLLGEWGLCFDLVGPAESLSLAAGLAERFPDTRFVLDHCGNGSARWFLSSYRDDAGIRRAREQWAAGVARLAKFKNVVCKISGVLENAAGAPLEAETLAPVVRHCLSEFGPDRVMFAGNWPVVLRGGTLAKWVGLLREIVSADSPSRQRRLFHDNAAAFYSLG